MMNSQTASRVFEGRSAKNTGMRFFLLTLVLIWLHANPSLAQIGLGGVDAVLTIPKAHLIQDGHAAVGFGYFPKPYGIFAGPQFDHLAYFTTIGVLPFAEISLRATRALDYHLESIGDRMASVRLRLMPETRFLPAVTIGLHDVLAIRGREEWHNALYTVTTKTIPVADVVSLEATVGYGVDWITARHHEFNGVFGGLSLGLGGFFFIKGEYDAVRYNYGVGLQMKWLTANLMWLDGTTPAFGANFKKRL